VENLQRLKQCTILIVDDDAKQLDMMKNILGNFVNNIIIASNGIEAIEILESKKIHIIFSDYVMPQMDGLKLCENIRNRYKNIPIVIMSNYSEKEKLLNIIPFKPSAYLIKPISLKVIMQTLHTVLDEMIENNQLSFKLTNGLEYFFDTKILKNGDKDIPLSKNELKLLELLANNVNKLTTNNMIDDLFTDCEPMSYKAIANVIYRLRKKIGKDSLENQTSLGYILKSI